MVGEALSAFTCTCKEEVKLFCLFLILIFGRVEWQKRVVNRVNSKNTCVYLFFYIYIYLLNLELAFYNKN